MIHPSLRQKLVHEGRWSRVFEVEAGFFAYESKFEADGLSISIAELTTEWDSWDGSERIDFANAFSQKPQISKSDEDVLEFLVEKGDEPIWSTMALVLTKHSNKKMVMNFLLERLGSGSEPKANFIQALYVLGDSAAVPGLVVLHDRLREQLKNAHPHADSWVVIDFLKCCEALVYLEGTEHYRHEIQSFLTHPDQRIREGAKAALAGPQPEEFSDAQ